MKIFKQYPVFAWIMAWLAVPGRVSAAEEAVITAQASLQIVNTAIAFALACTLIIGLVSMIRKIVTNKSHPY